MKTIRVVSTRLYGYTPGQQQFDYPVKNIKVSSGSQTITVAPGAQTGLFKTVGRLDPHSYRPNEFFANNWVYEGLVSYGTDGAIEPALAERWTISVDTNKVETVRFKLRENVKFHDGAAWNCTVAKLNFDHVFAPPLRGPDWHGWYSLPTAIKSISCDGETLVLEAGKPYYPLLQELTYIRPLRMLSPNAFTNGLSTSAVTHNSCPVGWGNITCWAGAPSGCQTVSCSGTNGIVGTGPFMFASRDRNDTTGVDDIVKFTRNANYWGGSPDVDIDVVRYETADEVEEALLDGSLDAVIGAGVLRPSTIQRLQYNSSFEVQHTEPIMNTFVVLNIDDINVRKTVVHAVNKNEIITKELGGIEKSVSQLFQTSAPYCDLDLVPKFDYDIEKAQMIACTHVTYTSCGIQHTLTATPSRVVTMNQGVTEFMLAMGLASKMVGTAYLDDTIWPKYADAYSGIPVLSSSYPDEATLMSAAPNFILGSYASAFREKTCTDKCRGIFSNATIGPCNGPGSDRFESGSNTTTRYSTCRPQLHDAGIGTWLEPVSCEDKTLRPQGGATEQTVYTAIRQIGEIFNTHDVAEQLIAEIRNDFAIAEKAVQNLETELKTVWLDCIDCCNSDNGERTGIFVGAGTGAPNLIIQEAGLKNVFAGIDGSWACVTVDAILSAKPDTMIIVDASWDTAISKIDFLHNHSEFCNAKFVKGGDYITIPFSASTLGPRNGAAALDMALAAIHLTTGSATVDFKSGVKFISPEALEKQTAGLKCPFKISNLSTNVNATSNKNGDDATTLGTITFFLIFASALLVLMFILLGTIVYREKRGQPFFTPLLNSEVHPGEAKARSLELA